MFLLVSTRSVCAVWHSSNSDPTWAGFRGLMAQTAFDTTYTAVTADGAQWLIRHLPEVRLVGIDALSIAVFADLVGPHEVLLRAVRPLWPHASSRS